MHSARAEPLERPVVVYDGECPFCLRSVGRMVARDRHKVFEYVPRQSTGLDERFPRLAESEFNTGMRLVHTDGAIDVGADAVYGIASRLPGWKTLAWLYRVPVLKGVCRFGYGLIAKYRYKLARRCDNDACEIR